MSFTVIMIFRLKFGKFSHFVSITMLPLLFPQKNYLKNRSIFDSRHLNCVCGFLSKFVLGIHRKKIVQTTNFDSFMFHNTLHIDEITEIKPKRKKHKNGLNINGKCFLSITYFIKWKIFFFTKKSGVENSSKNSVELFLFVKN